MSRRDAQEAQEVVAEQRATLRELEIRLRSTGPAGISPAAQKVMDALQTRIQELESELTDRRQTVETLRQSVVAEQERPSKMESVVRRQERQIDELEEKLDHLGRALDATRRERDAAVLEAKQRRAEREAEEEREGGDRALEREREKEARTLLEREAKALQYRIGQLEEANAALTTRIQQQQQQQQQQIGTTNHDASHASEHHQVRVFSSPLLEHVLKTLLYVKFPLPSVTQHIRLQRTYVRKHVTQTLTLTLTLTLSPPPFDAARAGRSP